MLRELMKNPAAGSAMLPAGISSPSAWSVDDLCRDWNFSRSFLYGEIRAGRLQARKIGRNTRILAEDKLEYEKSWSRIEPRAAAETSVAA